MIIMIIFISATQNKIIHPSLVQEKLFYCCFFLIFGFCLLGQCAVQNDLMAKRLAFKVVSSVDDIAMPNVFFSDANQTPEMLE